METTYTTDDRDTLTTDDAPVVEAREVALPAMQVSAAFHQLGIFVIDGSGSMGEKVNASITKAQATNKATREVLTRFKAGRKQDFFSFAVVTFDEKAQTRLGATAAAEVDDNASYDPLQGHGGGTFIGSGLNEAGRIAEGFLASARTDIPTSVVIVVLSDGACGDVARTKQVADRLKQNDKITLCAAYFGMKGQSGTGVLETLEEIASDPVIGCKTIYDAETLRDFFIASVSAAK
jgi:Mg-chelatase subunit ChlD